MSGFTVPFSSSPPSTPDSRMQTPNGFATRTTATAFNFNLSTTPAGPPPSSAPSFTPAGPPLSSSFFNSSQPSHLDQRKPLFSSGNSLFSSHLQDVPSQDEDMNGEYDTEEHRQESGDGWEGLVDGTMDVEGSPTNGFRYSSSQMKHSTSTAGAFDLSEYGSSFLNGTPRGFKRSRSGAAISHGSSQRVNKAAKTEKDSVLPVIVKDMATQMGSPPLAEPEPLILETEDSLRQLHDSTGNERSEAANQAAIAATVKKSCKTWDSCRAEHLRQAGLQRIYGNEDTLSTAQKCDIPDDSEPGWYKATFLAKLLLQLHHPPAAHGMEAPAMQGANKKDPFMSKGDLGITFGEFKASAYPKMLLEWLDQNHRPYDEMLGAVHNYHPNPTAHEGYWDIILSLLIRGKIGEVVGLMRRSNFQYARSAKDDGHGQLGYKGMMLNNVDRVVKSAAQVLEMCPALQDGDWDLAGSEWTLFRKRVEQAKSELSTLAEDRDRNADIGMPNFEAANFGIKRPESRISQSARQAESRVPWAVYQSLQTIYGILVGDTIEVLTSAQDWIEATIGLTAWWNGEEDEEVVVGSLAMTRRSLRRVQMKGSRLVDINPTEAYLRRLSHAFEVVTNDENQGLFHVSSISKIEVGLASIFEGNVEGVILLLRGYSLPVASAVVELASLGGWYNPSSSNGMMEDFDESDLLLLSSYGQQEPTVNRDSIMIEYAERLADVDVFDESKPEDSLEGWEVSTQIISRLQDKSNAEKRFLGLVKQVSPNSERRVDKLMDTCKMFGMQNEGRRIAERYADSINTDPDQYGTAITYYARSHSSKRVKDAFDNLISNSLVQSMALPPLPALDDSLRRLVTEPETGLGLVAFYDQKAAKILHQYLTGYATLRKFYDLRDEESILQEGKTPVLRPLARRRAAAATLVALIRSASDSIYGGLYDDSRQSVVPVDGLLVLLGECMVFVNHNPPILSQAQNLVLLSAIESLETVSSNIYSRCEDCFASTLSSYRNGQSPPNPQEMMRKTASSLTSSSGFSLVGSEMLGESMTSGGGSGSMVKVGERRNETDIKVNAVKRGWDWRQGIQKNASGADVLRILRLGLAKDMAKAWLGSTR